MVKSLVLLSAVVVTLVACASVADLDVKYNEADGGSVTPNGTSSSGNTPPDADASSTTPFAAYGEGGRPAAACACDADVAQFCCAAAGGPTCVEDEAACKAQSGALLGCFGPDIDGSFCCAHHIGGFTLTAFAGECRAGTSIVCTLDTDCPNGKCTVGACAGVAIGTCDGTPVCP